MRHSQRPDSQHGHIESPVLVPYPVFAGVRLKGTIYPYARTMAWNIQTVASCFVKRRNYTKEHVSIGDRLQHPGVLFCLGVLSGVVRIAASRYERRYREERT